VTGLAITEVLATRAAENIRAGTMVLNERMKLSLQLPGSAGSLGGRSGDPFAQF
jgi:hypothetical protein